ncbi:MAG: response regulator [Chitinivibrionia bacterium]|nr:response regulator [Chitinivibrionia bacterium]
MNYCLTRIKQDLEGYFEIYPAQCVKTMFKLLKHITPSLIILDVNMPEFDGYEAIQILKSSADYSHIPVIFLTSEKEAESEIKGLNLGAVDYILKPFNPPELIQAIRKQLPFAGYVEPVSVKKQRVKIIVLDDMTYTLVSIKSALGEQYDIFPVATVDKLFKVLGNVKPDLILLDINMPEMNGYEICQKLKSEKNYADIPIVFLTSQNDKESVLKGISMGAAAYVAKPISYPVLVSHIERIIGKRGR